MTLGLASSRRWLTVGFACVCLLAGDAASADNADVSVRSAAQRTDFTYDEIKDGFFKTAFHAELQFDRRVDRIRKFDEPVRVVVVDSGSPDRRADVAAIVADIHGRVDHLDLAMAADRQSANLVVILVQRADFAQTVRLRYGQRQARQIQNALHPECLSGIAKDGSYRIRRAEVIVPVDAGEFQFNDCAYEELLQALGLINDDNSLPWTMFNDDVQMGFFDVYDQYLVNILYDPRIRAGMTKEQVEKVLPDIVPAVRAWVTKTNPPSGGAPRGSRRPPAVTATLRRQRFPTEDFADDEENSVILKSAFCADR